MPIPSIPAGNLFMNATLYTGTGAALTVTNGGTGTSFQPDFIWAKSRTYGSSHGLVDSVRGISSGLNSNSTAAQTTLTDSITSINSNGFSLGADSTTWFNYGGAYVAWQWLAGGTAVSNTAGTITSSVSANTTSGFSIATFTKNATNVTVGHGLGVTPAMIIVKGRGPSTSNWLVYHKNSNASPQNGGLVLDLTTAFTSSASYWNNTAPTSTVFTVGAFMPNENSVAYCWSEVAGYSAFGSYTGNGSADGAFIYTGFRPRFILHKAVSTTSQWMMFDTARNTYNVLTNAELLANSSAAEGAGGWGTDMDILSNGFKFRGFDNSNFNYTGITYIYAAFAENPFKYALAR